jgi:hypothetical protein
MKYGKLFRLNFYILFAGVSLLRLNVLAQVKLKVCDACWRKFCPSSPPPPRAYIYF